MIRFIAFDDLGNERQPNPRLRSVSGHRSRDSAYGCTYGCTYGCKPRHPTSSQHRAVSRIRESEDGPCVFSQSNPSPISQNLNPPKVLALAFKPSISPELSAFKAPVPPHTTPFQSLNNPNDVKSNDDNNEYDEEDSNVTTESNTESNPTEITSSSRSITSFPETVKSTSESVP